ncbi:MAG: hypothetical protein ABIP42_09500, partial [Planctomycetota bacterium]
VAYALERTERLEPKAKRSADEMILKMLGLIPSDMDLLEENLRLLKDQVGGFYDPTTKTFYLMDNCPIGIAKVVLAHELGHAIDDQLYDIDGTMTKASEHTDIGAAYQAVVEGSGTDVMARWTADHTKEIDLFGMMSMQEEQSAAMARSPMILWKPLLGAYLKGVEFLKPRKSANKEGAKSDPNVVLDHAFRSPPKSMEQILHPEKYWDLDKRDEPIPVEQACAEIPAEWTILRRDVMGELTIGIWSIAPAQRAKADSKMINSAASMEFTCPVSEGWGGDEVVLLGKAESARALRWLTVWDSDRDAAEFYGAASMIVPELKASLATLAGGKASQTVANIRYASEREVVIELGYGVKGSELKQVFAAVKDR